MKVEIQYKEGKVNVNGTFTDEEKGYVDSLKEAADRFYKAVENIVEVGRKLEGVLEIKVNREEH